MPTTRRAALILALWGAATAFGLAFAAWTTVGPILLTLAPGHGVHAGDLVAFSAGYTVAAVLTRRLLATA
jgi:thiosulfate reductase cytochrome b subunit